MSNPIVAENDFVVKFANVNGSGSASANEIFARSILRMGVPIASRNIFPSNIQGLPTWYEVRVSGGGWVGRHGGVDILFAHELRGAGVVRRDDAGSGGSVDDLEHQPGVVGEAIAVAETMRQSTWLEKRRPIEHAGGRQATGGIDRLTGPGEQIVEP